jgi:hypothetical protein
MRRLQHVLSLAVVAAAWLLLIGSESRAGTITLPNTANNLEGNTVDFPHTWTFTFNLVTATGSGTAAPDLSSIAVNAVSPLSGSTTNTNAVLPFGFALVGSVVSAATGQNQDLFLNFTVTAPKPIDTVILSGTGGATAGAFVRVDETFINGLTGLPDGSLSLSGGGTVTFTLPTPTTDLIVSKNIHADGGSAAGGSASYSSVVNAFNIVPEPAGAVMLGSGMLGVLGFALSRRKNKV